MLWSWWRAVVMLVSGVLVTLAQDRPWLAVATFGLFAVMAFLLSPLPFPRPRSAAPARQRGASDDRPVIYWRPGCQYCLWLRLRLGRSAARADWVNIWRDPAGAAAVRAVTGGNETVPTVVVNGESVVNPEPAWLRQRLAH